ncbi:MAG: MFS transporter [Polyangiaceae bacterium]
MLSRAAGILGYQVLSVVIGWHVYSLTGRALDLGYVGLAQFVPAFALSLVTGQVVDRFDRRAIVVVCLVVEALTSALLLAAIGSAGTHGLRTVYGLLVVFGTARAFAGPASQALAPNLVPRALVPRAVAWSSTVWQLSTIGGPALGGLLYGVGGARLALSVSIGLVVLAALCVLATKPLPPAPEDPLPKAPPAAEGALAKVFAGLVYVFRERAILGTISLDLFAVLLGGAVALMPMFAQKLGTGPLGLGLLRSAPAVGATATALFLGVRPLRRFAGRRMLVAVAVFGLATIGFGLSKSFVLSLVCLVVLGAADMVSVVVRRTLLQVRVPDAMRGRVYAVGDVFVGASNELGELESGLTAHWLGAETAVVVGGIGTLLVVLAWAIFFPDLRRIDRLTEGDGEGD